MDRRRRASETNQPGVEPEIIPPDDVRWRRADSRMHSAQRVYVARIGPVGFAIMAGTLNRAVGDVFFLLVSDMLGTAVLVGLGLVDVFGGGRFPGLRLGS